MTKAIPKSRPTVPTATEPPIRIRAAIIDEATSIPVGISHLMLDSPHTTRLVSAPWVRVTHALVDTGATRFGIHFIGSLAAGAQKYSAAHPSVERV